MPQLPFRTGDVFFCPGDASERAYLLQSGRVEVLNAGGRRVATFDPGDVFGEMALVEERPHALLARASTDGVAETLTRDEFEATLLREPVRCKKYLTRLFERLRLLSARVADEEPPVELAPDAALGLVLTPLTPEASQSLRDSGLTLPKLPFRIGRASEADEPQALDLNDLWILDDKPFKVSRNHLSIEAWERGRFIVRDRGSFLGTVVNDQTIGGKSKRQIAELKSGDNTIIIGPAESPLRFRVSVPAGSQVEALP
jgi:hypothetical protein